MPEPDTTNDAYGDLAAALHEVADQIATLAGTDTRKPQSANLFLSFGYGETDAPLTVPGVDAVAAALGSKAMTKFQGRGANRRGEHKVYVRRGPLSVNAYTSVPVPPTRRQTMADLEQEIDQLRAQLATRTAGEPE